MTPLFQFQNAEMRYGSMRILHAISLEASAGEFVAIGGPNGAGKSTLLSLMAGLIRPTGGSCRFLGREIHLWPRRDFAKKVAMVTQSEPSAFPFTAAEVVAMGRMPHASGLYESNHDRAAINDAMIRTGTDKFRDRDFRTLSGGEKQRVILASALAQEPQVLLLDEPATHLDLEHQVALHQLLHELKQSGLLIIAITHDLNLAAAYADRLLLIHEGQVKADGTPAQVLTPPTVRQVFHVDARIGHSISGKPWLSYGPMDA